MIEKTLHLEISGKWKIERSTTWFMNMVKELTFKITLLSKVQFKILTWEKKNPKNFRHFEIQNSSFVFHNPIFLSFHLLFTLINVRT